MRTFGFHVDGSLDDGTLSSRRGEMRTWTPDPPGPEADFSAFYGLGVLKLMDRMVHFDDS